MLQKLFIKNYALIDRMEMDFSPAFNVITGETGTGKSIMIKGLGLILGNRAEKNMIRKPDEKIIVEGHFDITAPDLKNLFEELDLDWEETTIIRREISPSGKSRAFVNDTPVLLDTLEKITAHLIDIHSQHQHLLLQNKTFRFNFLDTLADNTELLHAYRNKLNDYRLTDQKLNEIRQKKTELQESADYRAFQLKELEKIDWEKDWNEAENRLKSMENQAEILEKLRLVNLLLEDENYGISEKLREVKNILADLSHYSENLARISGRIENLFVEMQEIQYDINAAAQSYELMDISEKKQLEEEINFLYTLMHKHHKQTPAELHELYLKWQAEENDFSQLDMEISRLESEKKALKEKLKNLATQIRNRRQETIPHLEQKMNNLLAELGMEHSRIKLELKPADSFNRFGMDELHFLLSSDKGKTFGDVAKIASGGELSRIMLTIKYLLSSQKELPTIIFDEIDAGVSGEIARKMAQLMEEMSRHMQIIVITHLPQTAARGDKHFKVYKTEKNGTVYSTIKELSGPERIKEIAEMVEGKPPSKSALEHAAHLLKN